MMNKGNFIPFVPTRACALCMPSMDGLTSTPSPTIFAIPAKAVCTFVYFDFAHTCILSRHTPNKPSFAAFQGVFLL